MAEAELPEGFAEHRAGGATLIAATEHLPALVKQGLDRAVEGIFNLEPAGAEGRGRGSTARIPLGDGTRARIKQMRRGGVLGPLWRDRFRPGRRLLDNLRVPLAALARGVATARPVALWVVIGPPGLCRAWLATEEIEGACDLAHRIAGGNAPTPVEVDAVVSLVRAMHDRGIDHRDLNLGNLLLADPGPGAPRAFVIDLDRARIRPGPLGPRARMRALRRLERSAVKLFGARPVEGFDLRSRLYEAYAANEPRWVGLAERAQRANRLSIALHRLGWFRAPGRGE